ncbi:MAG: hypothetical protein RL228_989 [Actinomycetota bacterium]
MSPTPSQAARRAGNTGPAPESASITDIIKDRLFNTGQSDQFGFDRELNDRVFMAALRPLAEIWFRTQVRGIENIPNQGAALIAGNHSGAIALDALMTQLAIFDTHPFKRHIHMLAADLVFEMPIVKDLARAAGHTTASRDEAMRLLCSGKLVGVWPEGFSGVGKTWMRRYELQQFGKGGFVSTAKEANVPLIPLAIVGAEEAYPMVANIEPLARLLKLPYFPVTPTFPLLGPLGAVPLPSKWIIQFGKPIPAQDLPSVHDEKAVLDFAHHFRNQVQSMVDELVVERGNPWV